MLPLGQAPSDDAVVGSVLERYYLSNPHNVGGPGFSYDDCVPQEDTTGTLLYIHLCVCDLFRGIPIAEKR